MADQLNDALKPCQFCGGEVELEETQDQYRDPIYGYRKWWGVVCRNTENVGGSCAVQIRPSASKEAALERWNTRSNTQESSAAQGAMTTEALSGIERLRCNFVLTDVEAAAVVAYFDSAQPSDATAQPNEQIVISRTLLVDLLDMADDAAHAYHLSHKGYKPHVHAQIDATVKAAYELLANTAQGKPDRHELQKEGRHPAPCARMCEATAFNIEIRGLKHDLQVALAAKKG